MYAFTKYLPCDRQLDTPARSLEEFQSERGLKALDLLTEQRLCDADIFGRAREMQFSGQLQKSTQNSEVQVIWEIELLHFVIGIDY
jgi:hypothetical protein